MKNTIFFGENLEFLKTIPAGTIQLIYIDPPFNTGREQARTRIRTVGSDKGDRVGFKGRRYETQILGESGYADKFDDFIAFTNR